MQIGEFATYHDGSVRGGIRTTLVAKALTSSEQKHMVSLLAYLEDYGFNHLNSLVTDDNISADRLLELVFHYQSDFQGQNIYVLYLEDMIEKFKYISVFGTWDFAQRKSEPMHYKSATCFSVVNNVINCKGGIFDLNRGVMSNGAVEFPLKAVLFVNNGYVVNEKYFTDQKGDYLQILMKNNKIIRVQVLSDRLFWTNFNQQYLLGNYDKVYFEEVYNNFPVVRVLKVKRAVANEVTQ